MQIAYIGGTFLLIVWLSGKCKKCHEQILIQGGKRSVHLQVKKTNVDIHWSWFCIFIT